MCLLCFVLHATVLAEPKTYASKCSLNSLICPIVMDALSATYNCIIIQQTKSELKQVCTSCLSFSCMTFVVLLAHQNNNGRVSVCFSFIFEQ